MTLCYACDHDGETATARAIGTLPEREVCVDEFACWQRVRSYWNQTKEERAALASARANADALTPLLLSHYEHALDMADPAIHVRRDGDWQRAGALRKARALRDLLTALGDESACKVARDERLARVEAGR